MKLKVDTRNSQSQFGKCGPREHVFAGPPWATTMSPTATKEWIEPRETVRVSHGFFEE